MARLRAHKPETLPQTIRRLCGQPGFLVRLSYVERCSRGTPVLRQPIWQPAQHQSLSDRSAVHAVLRA